MKRMIVKNKCDSKDGRIFKEEESIGILKILCLIKNIWVSPNKYIFPLKVNVVKENISQESSLKNIDETRDYFIEDINQINWQLVNT